MKKIKKYFRKKFNYKRVTKLIIIGLIIIAAFYVYGLNYFLKKYKIEGKGNIIRQDFYIDTKNISEFGTGLIIKKTGKLISNQDINLSSQVSGKVSKIYVKEGEYVKAGDIISKLDDSIANYGFALEKAKNTLNKMNISYESTQSSLNKRISDLEINMKNLKIDETDSKSSLELGKIENSIKKLALDYDNLKISNLQTVKGFKNSMGKDLISFSTYLDDIIDFSDKLLGVTNENRDANNDFESYMGAKNIIHLQATEELLIELINYKNNELNLVNFDFYGNSGFNSNMLIITNGYSKIANFLDNLEMVLDNSIHSIGSLPESKITTYKTNVAAFWSSYNINNGGFIALKNSINSFLDTFTNSEESLLKQIELLESDRKIYVKSLDVNLELDESNLEEAIINKDLSLRELDTLITDAKISYKQALSNYNKLVIRAPISGVIGKIFINVGQEVGQNTQLFNISNTSNNEVIISFSKNELDFVSVGEFASVNFNDSTYTGSIYSISNIADNNLKYLSRVSFKEGVSFIGNIVDVKIPINTNKIVLPVNIIKINNSGIGTINILKENKIEQLDVELGEIYGDKIEILDNLSPDLNIITNYIDNFDSDKFNLKIK